TGEASSGAVQVAPPSLDAANQMRAPVSGDFAGSYQATKARRVAERCQTAAVTWFNGLFPAARTNNLLNGWSIGATAIGEENPAPPSSEVATKIVLRLVSGQ